jgi:WXG100 family type VII secretion target
MPASKVRGDYASLAQIAQGFGREANNSRQSLQRITSKPDVLRGGDWVGTGADKFYQEMDSSVLPAQKRLIAAGAAI